MWGTVSDIFLWTYGINRDGDEDMQVKLRVPAEVFECWIKGCLNWLMDRILKDIRKLKGLLSDNRC